MCVKWRDAVNEFLEVETAGTECEIEFHVTTIHHVLSIQVESIFGRIVTSAVV
jgi:hypothetical protein